MMNDLAKAILKTGGIELAASILDALLSCDSDERLTDNEAEDGQALFESLCELSPESVTYCQTKLQGFPDSPYETGRRA